MFYEIKDGEVNPIQYDDIDDGCISIGYLSMEELIELYQKYKLDRQVIEECYADKSHLRTSLDIYDDYSFGVINVIQLSNISGRRDKIAFLIRKNQFILVKIDDEDNNTMEIFENSITRFKQKVTLEKVIFGILDTLMNGGTSYLEKIEMRIMDMEKNIVEKHVNELLNKEIYDLRNRLSILRNYYEQLVDIGEGLQENENGLLRQKDLRYFKIFADKASRLSENTKALSEALIHLREALDATLNYSLNNIMKLFTVVTTVFMPLTLIAGWYGMNFNNMPELSWQYGYTVVIAISLAVVVGCIMFFKKKKFL